MFSETGIYYEKCETVCDRLNITFSWETKSDDIYDDIDSSLDDIELSCSCALQ